MALGADLAADFVADVADGLLVSLLKLSVTSVILSVTNGFGSGWVIVESLEIIRYICYSIRC